jgi:hypothetical protein
VRDFVCKKLASNSLGVVDTDADSCIVILVSVPFTGLFFLSVRSRAASCASAFSSVSCSTQKNESLEGLVFRFLLK